jgi:hypothetical protein
MTMGNIGICSLRARDIILEGHYAEVKPEESLEENLITYIILDAIHSAKSNKNPLRADADLYWLFDEHLDEEQSFAWYCSLLQWHPRTVRNFLRRNWDKIDFDNIQIARVAMGSYPSNNVRFDEDGEAY